MFSQSFENRNASFPNGFPLEKKKHTGATAFRGTAAAAGAPGATAGLCCRPRCWRCIPRRLPRAPPARRREGRLVWSSCSGSRMGELYHVVHLFRFIGPSQSLGFLLCCLVWGYLLEGPSLFSSSIAELISLTSLTIPFCEYVFKVPLNTCCLLD